MSTFIPYPYEGNEPYIFISYVRKDMDTVLPVIAEMVQAGYRVWYDQGIHWSEEWPDEIAFHLAGSAVCMAFHSKASVASRHCQAELHHALSKEQPILSVYLEEDVQLDPGLEMYLDLVQSVKLYEYADIDAFVERLTREKAFAPCMKPEWNKIGQIQWKLNRQGVLTIAKNEDYNRRETGSIPLYQEDPLHKGSTAPWMSYREEIHSLVIQDNIDEIGNRAFQDCADLTSVTIGNSVTTIGDHAFAGCTGLTSITIPRCVTSIGEGVFYGCAGLIGAGIFIERDFISWFKGETIQESDKHEGAYKYDVALSYASEQRDTVRRVKKILEADGLHVFYDETNGGELIAQDLYTRLYQVFRYESRYTAVFVSADYLRKDWTMEEADAAMFHNRDVGRNCIIPVCFGDADLPDLDPDIYRIHADGKTAVWIAEQIRRVTFSAHT